MSDGKLRIVIPMGGTPLYAGGAIRLAFDEAKYLADLGHEVWTVSPDTTGEYPEHTVQDGVHILCYPQPQLALLDPRRNRIHQRLTIGLLNRHISGPVDLVHGHSLLQYAGAMEFCQGQTTSCFSVHSPVRLEILANGRGMPFIKRRLAFIAAYQLHRLERKSLELAACITSDSRYTRSVLGMIHGMNIQQKTKVVPGWVDLERFCILPDRQSARDKLGWCNDIPILFTLRRLVPRMGLENLLYALQKVMSSGCEFQCMIGGKGPLHEKLEGLIRELGLSNHVFLMGFVPDDLVPIMYGAADAFVLPTVELECFGLPVLESFACGRPVLATPVGAIPELVEPVEPKWLAADTSVGAIAGLVTDFLANTLPLHDPIELCSWVSNNYLRENILDKLIQTTLDVISRPI